MRAMEDKASSAFARIASALAFRKSRNVRNTAEGSPSGHIGDQVEIQIIRHKPNELHTIRPEIARGGRYDGYAFLRLNQGEDRLHRIRLVLHPRRKAVRSARSNDGVENSGCSFAVKKYESFIRKVGKPNLFVL